MSDELSFGNGKKLSREDFRREIKEGSLSKDARFKKILSAFDVNGNGQADDGEIDDLFGRMASYAGRDGNSVFDRREIEAFLEDTQVAGKSLQSMGMSANELMGFFKAEPTSGARETYTYNSETGELSEDEIKEETISFIDEEFKSGMAMLEGYDAGIISKGYAGIKEFLKSKLSKSNVARALYVKQETSELLRKAKRGDLTKKEYYGDIQQLMYDIFPEIERLDKDRQNQIRERIATLSPAEIQKEIDKIVQLPNRESPEYKNSIRDYLEGFSEITSDTTIVRQEGDRSGYFDKRIKSAYKLSGNEDLMTFEEVFQDRYGVEYKSENLDKLTTAKNELSIMYSMKATYDEIYKALHAEILDCEAMQEPCAAGMSEIVKQGKAYSLKTKIFGVLDKLGLTDDESKAAFIKKATGIEVSIENGEFVQGGNEYGLYKSGSIEQVTYIAKSLLNYVEKRVASTDEFEKKQQEVYDTYRNMFGENDTDGLVQSYINDNESAVGKLRSGVEGALGLAMVVSLFVCPPAALGFGIAGSVAGIGLEAVNEISRKNSSKEKFKELGIELAQNAALFASGIGAGKAGMSVRAMLVAQKCPKLMSVIADVGVDVTLSAISNLIIIGDLQLEQESVAQIVALLAGHIRAGRFKSGGGTKPAPEPKPKHERPTETPEIKDVPEPTKEQANKQKKLAEQNQKIAEKIGDDFKISDMDAEILKDLKDGQYHVITDKNGNQVKITKNGEDFDVEIIGKIGTKGEVSGRNYNPYIARNGMLERNSSYILNMDMLPKIDIGGGEIIDLENKMYKDVILSMKDGDSFTVGRDGNFITNQNNPYSSREHFVIYKQNGIIKIRDMSTNGTKILRDETAVSEKNISSGKMNSNQPYIINENDLPKLRLGNEILDLKSYRSLLLNLSEGQVLTIGREGDIRFGTSDAISRKHLIVYRSNGVLKIKDISANGTYIEANGIISKIKDKINRAVDYFDSSALSREELNILEAFKNNPAVSSAMRSASASKRMVKKIIKVLNNRKYVSQELKESILSGKANLGVRSSVVRCQVNKNALDDIIKLANGEDYIKKFTSGTSKSQIMRETPVGEVANVGGVLYVNNGTTLERINMSEKTFRKLFPPVKRFNTHQGYIGTCYLVSALENLYSTPLGRVRLYRLIGEDSEGIYTTTANSSGRKNYFKRFDSQHKHILEEGGLAIIEQGYCKNERNQALRVNPRETQIMDANHGGNTADVIKGLFGKEPIVTYDTQSIRNYIIKYANNKNFSINVSTTSGSDSNALAREYDLFSGHEYAIKVYNASTDSVLISNPWHSGVTIEVPMQEALKYFHELIIMDLK